MSEAGVEQEAIFLSSVLHRPKLHALAGSLVDQEALTPGNRLVLQAITACYRDSQRIDASAVIYKLEKLGTLEDAGGSHYIATIDSIRPYDESGFRAVCSDISRAGRVRALQDALRPILDAPLTDNPDQLIGEVITQVYSLGHQRQSYVSLEEAMEIVDNQPHRPSFRTGLSALDETIGGLEAGEMVIVGARPSVGKTMLGAQIAMDAAMEGHGGLIFSLEMSMPAMLDRMRKSYPSEVLSILPVWLSCTPGISVNRIFYQAQLAKIQHGISWVVLDYFQLLGGHKRLDNELSFHRDNSLHLQRLAKELDITCVVLSQLNRESVRQGERPALHHLKGCGGLEEDADKVFLLDRDLDKESGNLILAKNRNGPIGEWRVTVDFEQMRFIDY